jgi:Relaxase/Mobilisation nuclease domain
MVPKVAGKGRSFVGAGLYYLHDKGASTKERVAFTYTENLPTRDPDKAIKCMAYTAIRQDQIKARAGGSSKGRKLTQPVYCYSLSWAPGEDPSRDEMIAAAQATLKELGLSGHEALFVGHNDEPHPHIHVIVNRVHPETGVAAKLAMDHLKLSKWAQAFEERQGKIRCEQRVENNALRAKGAFVKDRDSQHSAEFHRWRMDRVAGQHHKRAVESAALDARHERVREQLAAFRDRKLDAKRKQIRDATRADWRDLYTVQRKERERLDAAQRSVFGRVRFFIKTYREDFKTARKATRKEMFKSAFSAFIGSKAQYTKLENKQKAERVFFADKLKARTAHIIDGIRKEHERQLAALREKQNAEREKLRSRQSEQSQAEAREIREGRDRAVYRQERRDKRGRDLNENKQDIVKGPAQPKVRRPTLSERFGKVTADARETGDRSQGGKSAPQEQPKPRVEKRPVPDRTAAFREQASDVTKKRETSKTSGGLSEKFKRAKDSRMVEPQRTRDNRQFKENAADIGRDRNRERSSKPVTSNKPKPT